MSTITFDTFKYENTALATKQDVNDVKVSIQMLEAKFDAKVDKMTWMLSVALALAIANFAK